MPKPTFIDLFCGCGGFTLGMERAGFVPLAAIDFDPAAVETLRANLPSVRRVLCEDLTRFGPADLERMLEGKEVDVIVGGPPCQGFSTARQRDGANHGARLIEDPRRRLYMEFLRFVGHFQPKVFVMENVLGIRSASGGEYFGRVQREARELGYRVVSRIEDAFELGVPQKRRRQLFIGTRVNLPIHFNVALAPAARAHPGTTLGEAISDLPALRAGEGSEKSDYDADRRARYEAQYGPQSYLRTVLEIEKSPSLTGHRARPHSARDLRDFKRLREGENCKHAMERGEEFEFPYDKSTFTDRYTRQSRTKACSTIVAHLAKDGLMFVHPTQNRTLTPREAARVQSFPDWFTFPGARTIQYRLIGNAVPPLVSEAIGNAVSAFLTSLKSARKKSRLHPDLVPDNDEQAVYWIQTTLDLNRIGLRRLSPTEFKRAWFSVCFLFPGLHPDGALDHGSFIEECPVAPGPISDLEPRLITPFYVASGWPVVLGPLAKEALRRHDSGEIEEAELYCMDALIAGFQSR